MSNNGVFLHNECTTFPNSTFLERTTFIVFCPSVYFISDSVIRGHRNNNITNYIVLNDKK